MTRTTPPDRETSHDTQSTDMLSWFHHASKSRERETEKRLVTAPFNKQQLVERNGNHLNFVQLRSTTFNMFEPSVSTFNDA